MMDGHTRPLEDHNVAATDGTLVQGALSGDRAAFAELYDRRARLIRAICFESTHDLDAAADLTQEVFLRALQKLHRLRDPQRFAPWLVGIARQVCREWRRGRLRDRRRLVPLTDDVSDDASNEALDERIALLRDVFETLPEQERLSLQTFYLSGLDAEQARTVLGLSRATFYRVLAKACDRLGAALQRQEVRP
jgi:RNA polymerase sigma-70 factor (ECF subfamily)